MVYRQDGVLWTAVPVPETRGEAGTAAGQPGRTGVVGGRRAGGTREHLLRLSHEQSGGRVSEGAEVCGAARREQPGDPGPARPGVPTGGAFHPGHFVPGPPVYLQPGAGARAEALRDNGEWFEASDSGM